MRVLVPLLFVVLLSFHNSMLMAATIYVPADQPTIQAGIDAAVDGDTVLVADGVYTGDGNRDIDFLGKAITVMSANGPENCELDLGGSNTEEHLGFSFQSGEGPSSILQGFTIRNGWSYFGAGIRCFQASPTIVGNIITENEGGLGLQPGKGAGIFCFESSPLIENNTITNNRVRSSYYFEGNGGGIYCYWYSSPTIRGNIISGNQAGVGPGISCYWESYPVIEDNIIEGNSTIGQPHRGGGIYCYHSSPTIADNVISENAANTAGGGIECGWWSSPDITGNTIAANSTPRYGGGISCYGFASPDLTNNTITGNSAMYGGGISSQQYANPAAANTILWNNSGTFGNEVYVGTSYYPSVFSIGYSDVEGGENSVYVEQDCILNWMDGMIDEDPLFVDPVNKDYHLLHDSPCIDAGDPAYPVPLGGACYIDMGCFEYWQGTNCHKVPIQW
jgi:hypothetical protein